ncbi:hypothetical protein K490DRAFT_75094 [Saccharata proteae CBS 121410]|uniref:Spt20-like SEP domain-containing protein n=1 Tax=Saccharata proteae CBS 121410 TaxID=1314787 RepID=A0A9P4LUZ7_9PEZI|nr:hypothetical protein K490DRAFT_75094 [Saccharata proteae CBS 121410]
MATAGPVRPTQALRNRRESQRPTSLRTNTKNANEDGAENGRNRREKRKPLVMTDEYILQKFQGHPPSLIIHLHQHHFRFEHQDGNFPYSSPMRPFLQHVREGTIPHFMLEEMFRASVPFYEGCLIVQIVDHRSTDAKTQTGPSTATGGSKVAPFSVHAYNSFITPSPFVPYPSPPKQGSDSPSSKSGLQKSSVEPSENKENAPVQSQTGMSTQKAASKTPKVATKVLFPTATSLQAEVELLANLPMPDMSAARRQQSRTAATPGSAQPPTPLTSVPPTPSSSSRLAKRQKMVLDETNIHEFEAHVINLTAPALYLDPAHSMLESQDIIEATSHPLNKNAPPAPKTRKRTTAELAADEAASAAEQSFMLFGDSQPGASAGQVSGEGETMRTGAPFEPRFSRFKTLENIKIAHEENERVKKEEEARQAQVKRQQQIDADEARRRDVATVEHNRIMMQRQQAAQAQAQAQQAAEQQRMRAQAAQQAQQAAQAQAQSNMMPNPQHAQFQQSTSQPPQGSPMLRQQTPMQGSPVMNGNPVVNHAMGGVPMAQSTSSQAGSPPRPGSAVPHAMPMARQMSRQQSSQHPGSAHGTPQMIQGTPHMGQAVPVTRHMTPQPTRMNPHGSPVAGMQGTPMMMQNSQMHPSGMTQQQFMQLQYQRQQQARQQAAGFHGSPGQQMSPEQMNAFRAQQQAQQHAQAQAQLAQQNHGSSAGTPTPQFTAQMARNQMSSSGSPVPGQQRPGTGHAPNGMPANMNPAQMNPAQLQQLKARHQQQQMINRIRQHYNGNIPDQVQAMIRQGGLPQVYQMMVQTMQRNQAMMQQRGQSMQGQQMPNQMQGMQGMGGMGGANMMQNGMTMQQMQQMQHQMQQNGQGENQYLAVMLQERQRLAMQNQQTRQNLGMQQGMNMGQMGMGGWPQGMGRGQGGMG